MQGERRHCLTASPRFPNVVFYCEVFPSPSSGVFLCHTSLKIFWGKFTIENAFAVGLMEPSAGEALTVRWSCNLCFAETTVCFVFVFGNGLVSQTLRRGQRFLLILRVQGIAFSSQIVCGSVLFIVRTRGVPNSQKKGPGRPLEKPTGGAVTKSWFLSSEPSVLPLCPQHGTLAGLPHSFPPFLPIILTLRIGKLSQ